MGKNNLLVTAVAAALCLSSSPFVAAAGAVSSLEEASRIAGELLAHRENPLQSAIRTAQEAAGDEARQADSLRALGQFQDPARLDVLASALGSKNAKVRIAALEALRDGTVNDASVLSMVRNMVLKDPEPGVQREALEVFVRYGDQADALSLAQSLGRAGGPAQDIAVREWIRIEKEIADAPNADKQVAKARR